MRIAVRSGRWLGANKNMKIKELLDNSWDIGLASGVLQGIELTPTLLPNQKEAIADARKALDRVAKRNQAALEGKSAQLSEAPNE